MTTSEASEPASKSSGGSLKYVLFGIVGLILFCGLWTCASPFLMLALVDPEDLEIEEVQVEPVDQAEPADPADEESNPDTKKSGKAQKSDKASRPSSRKKSKGKRKRR